jgi:hypothetical protein
LLRKTPPNEVRHLVSLLVIQPASNSVSQRNNFSHSRYIYIYIFEHTGPGQTVGQIEELHYLSVIPTGVRVSVL